MVGRRVCTRGGVGWVVYTRAQVACPSTPGYTTPSHVQLRLGVTVMAGVAGPGITLWAQTLITAWVGLPEPATLPRVVTVLQEESTGDKAA